MKYIYILSILLLSGCSFVPKMPSFTKVNAPSVSIAAQQVVKNEEAEKVLAQLAESESKAEREKLVMIEKYNQMKVEMQRAYDDLRNKDLENFDKIGELNYGIYFVTQEKKKVDINTTIAHLRSKEIMNRTDKLSDAEKEVIQKEVADEKSKTIDQLYIKYKQSIELAVQQKSLLDDAEALVAAKEKEKQALKESNRIEIEKLETRKKMEIEQLQREAADQVKLAKAAYEAQLLNYIIYSLGGIGILCFVIGLLMKSPTLITTGLGCVALAYSVATLPHWAIYTIIGMTVSIYAIIHFPKKKKKPDVSVETFE